MQTVKIGNTTYKTDRFDIFTLHAKCTGKHRKLKSKGAEKRLYPPHGASMSTADYVAAYEALNAKKNLTKWDWQPLSTTPTMPSGEDSAWEVDDATSDL
jgi:hypothetical protein